MPSDGNKTSIEAGSPSTTSSKSDHAAVQKGGASSQLSTPQDAGQTAYIQLKALEIADEDYRAHRNEIDAAVQKGGYKSISELGLFKVIGQPEVYTPFGKLVVLRFDGPSSPTGEVTARLIRLNVTLRLGQGAIDVVGKFVADSVHGTIQRDDKSVIPKIISHQFEVSEKLNSDQTTVIQMPGIKMTFRHPTLSMTMFRHQTNRSASSSL